MKVGAILFIILGLFMIAGYGMMSLLGFAMSFDAPGSEHDPQAWMNRFLFFVLPLIVFVIVLIWAWIAFRRGQYVRSFWIGSIFGFSLAAGFMLLMGTSILTMGQMKATSMQNAEDERLYPLQKYLRDKPEGADTILVFPGRIVAYRLYRKDQFPIGGPVGDLNLTRDTIILDFGIDTFLRKEELFQFIDAKGVKLTDRYALRNK